LEKDNSARRLLNILEKGKKISTDFSCKSAWRNLLDIKDDDLSLLFSRLGKVMTLQKIIIKDLEKYYPNQKKSYDYWSNRLNIAFSKQNINSTWLTFIESIDDHSIEYLRMSTDLLDSKIEVKIIEEEKLIEIRVIVDNLIKEVINLKLDENFKKYLITYLKKIIDSIDEYKITGITPIIESFESTLGHALVNKEFGENIKKSNLSDKFINILEKLNILIDTGNNISQITNGLMGFLPK
jgi:hypothetical protein